MVYIRVYVFAVSMRVCVEEIDRFNIPYSRDQDPLLLEGVIMEASSAGRIYYLGKRSFITPAYPRAYSRH